VSDPGPVSVVQSFTDDYLERCRQLSPVDIVRFLEDYRQLLGAAKVRPTGRLEGGETNPSKAEAINSSSGSGSDPDRN